jgi:hypothetical protein
VSTGDRPGHRPQDRPDVLGTVPGGDDDQTKGRPPRRARMWRLAAVAAAGLVALLALRSGLLSAPGGGSGGPGPQRSAGGLLVLRSDGRLLVEAGDDWSEGAELPGRLAARASLVPVLSSTGGSVLVGVAGRTLFSIDPSDPEDTPTPLGRARSVVAGSGGLGGALVERGDGRVVEVDAATGAVRDPAPFPGQPSGPGWRAVGLLSVPGAARSLLMAAPGTSTGDAARATDPVDLVLAAPARPVELGTQPEVRPVATVPRVLALGPDSVLAPSAGCSRDGCRGQGVRVVTVTRDDVLAREVAAPPDRAFTGTPLAGGSVSNLLVVDGAGARPALARVVAGGAATLLVRGSAGVDPAAGLVDDLDGTAYLVVREDLGSDGVVRAWAPGRPALVRSARAPAVPPGARLVCGCG